MFTKRFLTVFCLIVIPLLFAVIFPRPGTSTAQLARITNTSEEILNLNPSVSGDGRVAGFESTANLAGIPSTNGFRAIRADLSSSPTMFAGMATSRVVAPAISQDGSRIAFASNEDPLGANPDRNSEIFLFEGSTLKQITNTSPHNHSLRISDGNFRPSITDDGRIIAFASNRDLSGENFDLNSEIFLFDVAQSLVTQVTNTQDVPGATDAKISADGSRLAFFRSAGDGEHTSRELVVLERASGEITVIAANRPALSVTYGRAISDDGLRVVYSDQIANNRSEVFLFDARFGSTLQVTSLGDRAGDVPLHPTISGDGRRITFATRRNPLGANGDRSVELFLYDVSTGQLAQLTNAPAQATAEVVSSLNDDGSVAVFNFPRVLSGTVSENDFANNSEIYALRVDPPAAFGELSVFNAASLEPVSPGVGALAPESIAVTRGRALAFRTEHAKPNHEGLFPESIAGTTVAVNGRPAKLLYVSPAEVHFVVPPETGIGMAEIRLTNVDGFESRVDVMIVSAAPGLFSLNGNGRGEGIILNADNLVAGPFDPSGGQLRLVVFGTGTRNASQLSADILGRAISIESVHQPRDLPGLDEIHLLVPEDLRGAGTLPITVAEDNQTSNAVTVTFSGSFERDILINEILTDPPDGLAGDANQDGIRDSANDEFVELVNTTTHDIDLGGFVLQTRSLTGASDLLRHRFAPGTVFPAGTSIVIFGGGNPDPTQIAFAGAQVFNASSGGLSLNNGGGVVTLSNQAGDRINFMVYGGVIGLRGDANQSLTRSPDLAANFVLHQSAPESGGRLFSPGTRVDQAAFAPAPAISRISIFPGSAELNVGQELKFTAQAFDLNGEELGGVIFRWQSSNAEVASIASDGRARAIAPGVAKITAVARGVQSVFALLTVNPLPTPTPTPTRSPTPTPSPSPTPSPMPSPSASPSPSVSPTPGASPSPTPSPQPTPAPIVVISEFRTRGPNGGSDEFVELYNNSDAPVDVGGWKIRGSSSSGTVTTRLTINAGTIILPRGHFLATNSGGYSGTISGDQSYTSGIANDGGIALTTPDDSIVDAVGLSAGSAFREGTHLAPLPADANQGYERKPGGLNGSTQDTGDNVNDFQLLTPGDPQNLSSAPTPRPDPSPSPTVSPTPSPSPSTTPSSSPSPTASPTPTPPPTPSPTPGSSLVINEVDSDQAGTDMTEFIEIFDGGAGNTSLAGHVLVFYNGGNDLSYFAINLTGSTNAQGYYVVGNNGVAGVDQIFAGNLLQNGPDAVALYVGSASNFPNNTPVTTSSLIDAVVYGTGDPNDPGLLALLNPGQTQVDEDAGGGGLSNSIQRCPNGSGGARNSSTFTVFVPTPDAANLCEPLTTTRHLSAFPNTQSTIPYPQIRISKLGIRNFLLTRALTNIRRSKWTPLSADNSIVVSGHSEIALFTLFSKASRAATASSVVLIEARSRASPVNCLILSAAAAMRCRCRLESG